MDGMHRSLRRHGLAMVMVAGLSGGVAGGALGALASERPGAVVASSEVAGATSTTPTTTTRPTPRSESSVSSSASKPSRTTRPKGHDHADEGKSANGEGDKKDDGPGHGSDHHSGKDGKDGKDGGEQ